MIESSRARYAAGGSPKLSGYRKLVAFVVVLVCATVLQAIGQFSETIATFLGASFLVYVGGNVREHAHRGTTPLPKELPAPQAPPVRPGGPAPFDADLSSDRTAFDPERPAVDRDTLLQIVAAMANQHQQRRDR